MAEATVSTPDFLKNHFKELNLEFHLFPETRIKKFKSFDIFYKFISKEADFWMDSSSGRVSEIRAHFNDIKNYLNNALSLAEDPNNANNAISHLNVAIERVNYNRFPCVFSITEIGKQIKKMYDISPTRAEGYMSYLIENYSYGNFNDKNYFAGVIYGFAYENPELAVTLSAEERQARLSSIQTLNDFVNQSMKELSDETDRIHVISSQEAAEIEELKKTFEEEKVQLLSNAKIEKDNLLTESKQKIIELEELYGEKLRLSKPAQYWEDTKSAYFRTGICWTVVTVAFTVGYLFFIRWIIFDIQKQESQLTKVIKNINFDTIKYGILLTLAISVGIFLINLFTKLAISAFHLSRDANERLQLTHLYLALLNEKAVTQDERTIVLQSLFSRADTGLLKGDSSPTIPDSGIIGQLLKIKGNN
jgi:hypothetical protein